MSGRDPIAAYLAELGGALDASRRRRARILAEVADHLHESAAARGPAEALRRFGTADEVAARFRVELAATAAGWSVRLLGPALVAFVLLCGVLQSGAVRRGDPGALAGSRGPLTLVALEVCWLVAAVTALRWRRWRRSGDVTAETALGVARGAWVATAAALTGASLQISTVASIGPLRGWAVAVVAGVAGTAAAAVAAQTANARALRRARAAGACGPGDAIGDLLDLAGVAGGAGGVHVSPAARAARSLDPRARPWRFALVFAIAVGLVLAAGKGLTEGGDVGAWGATRGFATLAGAQAGVILVAYALLGRYLGLRPRVA